MWETSLDIATAQEASGYNYSSRGIEEADQVAVINLMHQRVSMDKLPQLMKLEMREDLR